MNPLMMLLQAAGVTNGGVTAEEDIQVTGQRPKPAADGIGTLPRGDVSMNAPNINAPAINLDNNEYIMAAETAKKNAPKREGMFGVKGTLRDVLGLFGDTYLVTNGQNAIYNPVRQKEKLGDAMAGFTEQPQQAMERVAAGGDAQIANAMMNGQMQNESRKQNAQSTNDYRDAMIADRKLKQVGVVRDRTARLLAQVKTPQQFKDALGLVQRWLPEGASLEDIGVDELMTPGQQALFAGSDMTVNQQQQIPFKERAADVAERKATAAESNAASNRIRANRPPAGRAAPQPTAMSVAAPLLDKVRRGQTLTKGEKETLDRTAPQRGAGRTRAIPPPPPGF